MTVDSCRPAGQLDAARGDDDELLPSMLPVSTGSHQAGLELLPYNYGARGCQLLCGVIPLFLCQQPPEQASVGRKGAREADTKRPCRQQDCVGILRVVFFGVG